MSKNKDVKTAATNGSFRDGKRGKLKTVKCIYPPCTRTVQVPDVQPSAIIPARPQPMEHPPFCSIHLEMLMFVLWVIPQIKVQQGVTPGGIITPGAPGFEQTKPTGRP